MKKIPTLFERVYEGHKIVGITDKVHPGMEWVLDGAGVATLKIDGSCCALIFGELYKRYDAKKGKTPPPGALPCCNPDPITGHHPHWVPCDRNNPADKWFFAALENFDKESDFKTVAKLLCTPIVTFEAVGPHFNGNKHNLTKDMLIAHGTRILDVPRTFEGLREYLKQHRIEGIVFWKDGEPQCKIKRSDFGFEW